MVVSFDVLGMPTPKGSSRAIATKTGRAVLVPSGSDLNKSRRQTWDANVRAAAAIAVGEREAPPFVQTAIGVWITFRLARPAGHWGKNGLKPSAPRWPIPKPDLDKLARSTLDALIGVVFDDDSRIVHQTIYKVYAEPGQEGATITISPFVELP
jgi:Holliday junction resolvase RusA-like endonuclease